MKANSNNIVFLEVMKGEPFNNRSLQRLAPELKKAGAIIVTRYIGNNDPNISLSDAQDAAKDYLKMVEKLTKDTNVPIYFGFPMGHIGKKPDDTQPTPIRYFPFAGQIKISKNATGEHHLNASDMQLLPRTDKVIEPTEKPALWADKTTQLKISVSDEALKIIGEMGGDPNRFVNVLITHTLLDMEIFPRIAKNEIREGQNIVIQLPSIIDWSPTMINEINSLLEQEVRPLRTNLMITVEGQQSQKGKF